MKFQALFPFLLSLIILPSTLHSHQLHTTKMSHTAALTDFIRTSCNKTLYPETCYSSLSYYTNAIQQDPACLARIAIAEALAKAQNMTTYISNLTRDGNYTSDARAASAMQDCLSNFRDAVHEIRDSLKQMRQLVRQQTDAASAGQSFRFLMSNVQTWMSAALTDEDTCTDGFEDMADCPMKLDLSKKVAEAKMCTSNALALVNSYAETGRA